MPDLLSQAGMLMAAATWTPDPVAGEVYRDTFDDGGVDPVILVDPLRDATGVNPMGPWQWQGAVATSHPGVSTDDFKGDPTTLAVGFVTEGVGGRAQAYVPQLSSDDMYVQWEFRLTTNGDRWGPALRMPSMDPAVVGDEQFVAVRTASGSNAYACSAGWPTESGPLPIVLNTPYRLELRGSDASFFRVGDEGNGQYYTLSTPLLGNRYAGLAIRTAPNRPAIWGALEYGILT